MRDFEDSCESSAATGELMADGAAGMLWSMKVRECCCEGARAAKRSLFRKFFLIFLLKSEGFAPMMVKQSSFSGNYLTEH